MATYADWRELLADPDLAAVSVTAPNFLHREIGVAVAEAGKHLWIEKPVGLTADDAVAVRDAVHASGVVSCVGFNYRNVPAVARARRIVESGQIGVPTHARVQLLTDYAAHPGSPLSWRYAVDRGGHGVLGDLASHGVDLLRFVLGEVSGVMAQTAIHIPQRPVADAQGHYTVLDVTDPGLTFGEVENEDYVVAILRMASGSPQRLRGQPRRGGGAEQLRVRGARNPGPGPVGLPAPGRAAGLRRRPVRRPADQHRLQRAG